MSSRLVRGARAVARRGSRREGTPARHDRRGAPRRHLRHLRARRVRHWAT